MFDVAEIGSTLAKEEYKARMPDIRAQLLEAQFLLKRAGVPVLIAIAGDDRIGSEEVIDLLNEWLDARYVDTQVFEGGDGGGTPAAPLLALLDGAAAQGTRGHLLRRTGAGRDRRPLLRSHRQ